MLFSATLDGNIAKLARELLRDPQRIEVAAPEQKHENIAQRLHYVDDGSHKHRLLEHVLSEEGQAQVIVFTATKHGADRLADKLFHGGHDAAALHGNMNQSQRNRTLARLRSGAVRVLVATDVAARGIDVASISHVINFDLPKVAEDYVHRIGRTGRAGASGTAISFASSDDVRQLKQIERYIGRTIERWSAPGFEAKNPLRTDSANAPTAVRLPAHGAVRRRHAAVSAPTTAVVRVPAAHAEANRGRLRSTCRPASESPMPQGAGDFFSSRGVAVLIDFRGVCHYSKPLSLRHPS